MHAGGASLKTIRGVDLLDGVCARVNNSAISTLANCFVSLSIPHQHELEHELATQSYNCCNPSSWQLEDNAPEAVHNEHSGWVCLKRALL